MELLKAMQEILQEMNDDIRTNRKKMGANQAEIKAKMDSHHEKLMAIMKTSKEKVDDIRDACLGKTGPVLTVRSQPHWRLSL
jgi:polyribonucleotide nucleotidyltransferase